MAKLNTPAISGKMYRHFAIVTVVITLVMAVFADGESRQAIAKHVAEREEAARVQQAQVAKFGKPKLNVRKIARSGDWGTGGYGDAFDASYGTPSDRTSEYARTSAVWRGRTGKAAAAPASYAPYGISQARWEAMSEAEREKFLRRMQDREAVGAAQREREIGDLMAASAARAGGATDAGESIDVAE